MAKPKINSFKVRHYRGGKKRLRCSNPIHKVFERMGKLTELVNKYRKAKTLAERLTFSGELVCEFGPELETLALRSCKREIAEEIYQETLIVIGKNLEKYRGNFDNEFRSWCFTILRRKLINHLRKDKSKQLESLDEGPMREVIAASDAAVSPGVKLDLEYAIELIISVKPRCALLLGSPLFWAGPTS